MTAPALPRAEGIWSFCARTWAASLPAMTGAEFDYEACRVALIHDNSEGRRYMRDAVDAERDRRAVVAS